MGDSSFNIFPDNKSVLDNIMEHILIISKGECTITDEMILNTKYEKYRSVLSALQILHEDLELYKEEFTRMVEADYQLELLRKKNRELTQFNYVTSHDLQEPLRTISSFSKILETNYADMLDEDGKLYMRFIRDSSKRLSNLINDLMNYSRLGNNYQYEETDINMILEKVVLDLGKIISELKPTFDINELPVINCARNLIHQVFQNLIGNAIKFRKPNEPIRVTVTCTEEENGYTFCVADNGIGIEPKFKDRIFGVFQRLHSKEEYDGTGIGLAICYKIIELHNGKIWIESELGVGSKFFFNIPKF